MGICAQVVCDAKPCEDFEQNPVKKNGDAFRNMSNIELAEYFSMNHMCDNCPAKTNDCVEDDTPHNCFTAWEIYLDQEVEA
jgi:hypothetical protein